jgi:DNA-binding NarL/FixJ family response regulator
MPTQKKTPIKIQIVEDHPLTAQGLRALIESQEGFIVCAESPTCAQAVADAVRTKPDLVITDISLPGRSGLELVQDLLACCPGIPTLIFSMHQENTFARRALEVGARGYVMKSDSSENLLAAIRTVLAGGIFVSPAMSSRILEYVSIRSKDGRTGVEALSPKEFEVFRLFGEGLATVDIASRLNMSPKTVDSHREHSKLKLEIRTMTELIAFASRWCASQSTHPT